MMGKKSKCLSPVAFGIGLGVASALFMLIFIWAGWLGGEYGKSIIEMWATIYPGLAPTLFGGIVGAVWGFVEGFIFGLVAAFIYNLCLCCCPKTCCPPSGGCKCCSSSSSCDLPKK